MSTHPIIEAEQQQQRSVSNPRIQRLLDNQHILFINCKFIFTKLPIPLINATTPAPNGNPTTATGEETQSRRPSRRKRKFLTKMIKNAQEMIEELTNGGPESRAEERLQNCLIAPSISKQLLEEQIEQYESSGRVQYSFSNCSFLQRESNFIEKLGIKLRRFVGVMFEVNYLTGMINVKDYTLKLKDLPIWSVEIAEQIIEEEK